MPNCLLLYFSQGESADKVADGVATGLRESGIDVDLHNLHGNPDAPEPQGYDLLGMGTPVYYCRLPSEVSDYLGKTKSLDGMPVFSFVMCGARYCQAGDRLKKIIVRRGGTEIGHLRFQGAGPVSKHAPNGRLVEAQSDPGGLDTTRRFGREVAEKCRNIALAGGNQEGRHGGRRFLPGQVIVEGMYSRWFGVDAHRCNGCGVCAKVCPTGNITVPRGGLPAWEYDCTLCMECQARCPKAAISRPISRPIFRAFIRASSTGSESESKSDTRSTSSS